MRGTLNTFIEEEFRQVHAPHHDALVIKISLANLIINRVLVDNGSSANVLFLETFKKMQLEEMMMQRKTISLISFDCRATSTIGEVELSVFIEGVNFYTTFLEINSKSAYNMILGQPWICGMKAVLSIYHQLIQFQTPKASDK